MISPRLAAGHRAILAVLLLLLAGVPAFADPVPADLSVDIRNFRTPLPGVTSGGQPTEDQLRQAAALGYQTVVSLRTAGEEVPFDEAELVESLGMGYVNLPIAGADGLTLENAEAFQKILDESRRPLLMHCGSGNRIGALFALKAHELDGKGAEEALQIGLDAGLTSLEPAVREKLGLPPVEPPEE